MQLYEYILTGTGHHDNDKVIIAQRYSNNAIYPGVITKLLNGGSYGKRKFICINFLIIPQYRDDLEACVPRLALATPQHADARAASRCAAR